jgi:hypothetical protein
MCQPFATCLLEWRRWSFCRQTARQERRENSLPVPRTACTQLEIPVPNIACVWALHGLLQEAVQLKAAVTVRNRSKRSRAAAAAAAASSTSEDEPLSHQQQHQQWQQAHQEPPQQQDRRREQRERHRKPRPPPASAAEANILGPARQGLRVGLQRPR